ncbi:MSCRAMM family protein, partial [Catellicoccus marimammalium]
KYTLKETQAPNGYEIAEDISFEVKDGKVVGSATNRIVMIDKLKEVVPTPQKQKVILSKQDVAGKEIAGAELTLTTNEQEVDSWISEEGKDHEFLATPNQEYTLQEVQAPKGYKLAESITFRVNEEGKVEIKNGTTWTSLADNKVIMVDAKKTSEKPNVPIKPTPSTSKKAKVEVAKIDVLGKEVVGAKLEILDANGKTIDAWISDTTSHKVELSDGKYTLKETRAPKGYEIAESIPFEVKDGKVVGQTTNTIVMVDKETKEERHKKPKVIKETVIIEKTIDDYHPSSGAPSQSSKEDDQSDLPQTGTHQSSIELVIGFGLLIISLCGFQWLRKRYN